MNYAANIFFKQTITKEFPNLNPGFGELVNACAFRLLVILKARPCGRQIVLPMRPLSNNEVFGCRTICSSRGFIGCYLVMIPVVVRSSRRWPECKNVDSRVAEMVITSFQNKKVHFMIIQTLRGVRYRH